MRKIKIIDMLLLSLILAVSFSNASAAKVGVKECLYSFNDRAFATYFNETGEQSGIFLKIVNSGTLNSPVYSYYSYFSSRGYFDNFGYYNPSGAWPYNSLSVIPMLQVTSGANNIVYAKCTFNIAERVLYSTYMPFSGSQGISGIWLTPDFNLTESILPSKYTLYKNYLSSGINSPYGRGNETVLTAILGIFGGTASSKIIFFNNNYNSPTSDPEKDFKDYGSWPGYETVIITSHS
jgi:hypothetical protein